MVFGHRKLPVLAHVTEAYVGFPKTDMQSRLYPPAMCMAFRLLVSSACSSSDFYCSVEIWHRSRESLRADVMDGDKLPLVREELAVQGLNPFVFSLNTPAPLPADVHYQQPILYHRHRRYSYAQPSQQPNARHHERSKGYPINLIER